MYLPDGTWLVSVREDDDVVNCKPATTSKKSSAVCVITQEGGGSCSICPLVPQSEGVRSHL